MDARRLKKFLWIYGVCFIMFWGTLAFLNPWILLIPVCATIFFILFFRRLFFPEKNNSKSKKEAIYV